MAKSNTSDWAISRQEPKQPKKTKKKGSLSVAPVPTPSLQLQYGLSTVFGLRPWIFSPLVPVNQEDKLKALMQTPPPPKKKQRVLSSDQAKNQFGVYLAPVNYEEKNKSIQAKKKRCFLFF
jgi:hypothetical protein